MKNHSHATTGAMAPDRNEALCRARVTVRGKVQGVGFRPFVYRLASALGLRGWVRNSSAGAVIEIEGGWAQAQSFLDGLRPDPPIAIHGLETVFLDPAGYREFTIAASAPGGEPAAVIMPDIAMCADCAGELLDPGNRRHLYPFINCAHCGPRYSIIESLPYDRARTAMKTFTMCRLCQAEYENPRDRRFHAQPNACPECGPRLAFEDAEGLERRAGHAALLAAARVINAGGIAAVKGIGGFHLLADARNAQAVAALRERKRREEKPLALMCPSLAAALEIAWISRAEQRALLSPAAPIVILRRRERTPSGGIAANVAPGNPHLGVMLPYSPLHRLLMLELGAPVAATSGNLAEEPLCIDNDEAQRRLRGIADAFLMHDRPILRPQDDSIIRLVAGREMLLRRARGFAPLPVTVNAPLPPLLAVGGMLKNAIAIAKDDNIFISQHLGDLQTAPAFDLFRETAAALTSLYACPPERIACDLHPDYPSTRFAAEAARTGVQHHYAHALSCMAENNVDAPALGIVWDGAGYGPDGEIWGGEFLIITDTAYKRFASWRPFPLPGGDRAAREPRRAALGLLFAHMGPAAGARPEIRALFRDAELAPLLAMLERGVNCPRTFSAGRLFDAVAALTGLRARCHYEGQAAMELEYALPDDAATRGAYPVTLEKNPRAGAGLWAPEWLLNWAPLVDALLAGNKREHAATSAKFHNALAAGMAAVAGAARLRRVALSGGCFQNKYLCERAITALEAGRKHKVYLHQRVPPNDGGLALGQIIAASRALRSGE